MHRRSWAIRPACIAREVTKLHEEFLRGRLSELAASLERQPARGEVTLRWARPTRGSGTDGLDQNLAERVEELIRQAKLDRKEALKLAARERGLTRASGVRQMVQSKKE